MDWRSGVTQSSSGLAARMMAIGLAGVGGPECLKYQQRPRPEPGTDEVLIRVHAAGVNRVDVFQRAGYYTPPPGTTDVPGVECAGEVVSVGAGVTRFRVGDAVCALVVGGGYAQYCVAPEAQVLPVPAGWDWIRAAAVMETYATTWTALYDHGRLRPGERVLIHGGSSGIGTTAIQLARIDGAAAIFTTAGSPEKCAACERAGATRAIDYRREDFESVVREATAGAGVDVIIDIVAGDYVPKNIALLAPEGRLVFVGRMSQQLDVSVNVIAIMYRRLVVTGLSLRGQTVAQKGSIVSALARRVWPAFESGAIGPMVDTVYPLERAAQAHRHLEASTHIGKIVLSVTH